MLKLGLMRALRWLRCWLPGLDRSPRRQHRANVPPRRRARRCRATSAACRANPRDFNALIGAGQAALELGDVQAAAGFFGRAEEANPNAPQAKIGLGAAMAHMGDADGAISISTRRPGLGAQPMMHGDRPRDGEGPAGRPQAAAQADYRLAISSLGSDEARRRLALSLAIGRDRKAALDTHPAACSTGTIPRPSAPGPSSWRWSATRSRAAQAIEFGDARRVGPLRSLLPLPAQSQRRRKGRGGSSWHFPGNASTRVAAPTSRRPSRAPAARRAPTRANRSRPSRPAASGHAHQSLEIAGRIPLAGRRR